LPKQAEHLNPWRSQNVRLVDLQLRQRTACDRTAGRIESNRVVPAWRAGLRGARATAIGPPHAGKSATASRIDTRAKRLLGTTIPGTAANTEAGKMNHKLCQSSMCGCAVRTGAVVATRSTTFVSPLPCPTWEGGNEQVLSGGRLEHESVTSCGNDVLPSREWTSRL
jgi:hypothetical protein